MTNTLDMNGQVLCAYAIDCALQMYDRHGFVEIRGLPEQQPLTFIRRQDLELLQKADALWRAPGHMRWANFHAD